MSSETDAAILGDHLDAGNFYPAPERMSKDQVESDDVVTEDAKATPGSSQPPTDEPRHEEEVNDLDASKRSTRASDSTCPKPLSWGEARAALRDVMEKYMETPLPVVKTNASDQKSSRWQRWFDLDMDFYAGSVPVSLILLVLSIVSLNARQHGTSTLNASATLKTYRAGVAASTLLVLGTLLSIFLMKRRQYTSAHDNDVAKRTSIARFLRAGGEHREASVESMHSERSKNDRGTPMSQQHHSGTSRTDIYPTYRRSESDEEPTASWHSVPTLLLVRGDFVALQVGDIAPAKCKLLDFAGTPVKPRTQCIVTAGERICVATYGKGMRSPLSRFPRGKSTVQPDSRELLALCNEMSIFVLEDTPLEGFLRLPNAKQRLPQVQRQLRALRPVVYLCAVLSFIGTFVIIFVRPDVTLTDLSLVLQVPFLAALAMLPAISPSYLFFLEVIGTARILKKIHPHVNLRVPHNSKKDDGWLFVRYVFSVTSSRLSLQEPSRRLRLFFRRALRLQIDSWSDGPLDYGVLATQLVPAPPASTFMLEKLGVATAFTLVDDELVCEPFSVPQQLLIPSGNGLKLLDLCPTYDSESDYDSEDERVPGRKRGRSFGSSQDGSDSDSDDEQRVGAASAPKRTIKAIRRRRRKKKIRPSKEQNDGDGPPETTSDDTEVQFEDPLWWHFLPSLKCIGLACLLVDDYGDDTNCQESGSRIQSSLHNGEHLRSEIGLRSAEKSLVQHISCERQRVQLRSLARCIGFNTDHNSFGDKGDLSFFKEQLRVNVISTSLQDQRLANDAHALGLEESRAWGLLRTDSSSVIVQDNRSGAYQLLTVGDPRVVTGLCREAWQGENSTILPLNAADRRNVLETSENWTLADLDVAAFAYSPVPTTLETRLCGTTDGTECANTIFMVENSLVSSSKEVVSEDWAFINNQIFLGVLGSSVIPRKEIEKLLETFDEAGVRFVYFSPRNMRRTKELATQIGIDVAWNCAISLRALDEGEEDRYRMPSTYADWTVNAKLPNGIENVRMHLKEVDNVPLLVSLFTDAVKESTLEMIKTFQDYNDTVVAMGLSHLPRNSGIFSCADISVGADVLATELTAMQISTAEQSSADNLSPLEVEFVSAISAHSCAFSLLGAASSSLMPGIIARGRASLEAVTAAAYFILFGCVAFSLFALFSMCAASTTVPFVPTMGSFLYLQVILPLVSLGLAMSDSDDESMHRVPPKNDQSMTFSKKEGARLYKNTLIRGLLPAVLTQILYLIAFGELMIRFEPKLLQEECSLVVSDSQWTDVIRCQSLKFYSGEARTSAGAVVLADMVLCVIVSSASYVHATVSVVRVPPWTRNKAWAITSLFSIACVAAYLAVILKRGTFSALPWYFFFLSAILPFLCLLGSELIKRSECKHIERAAKLRRLQFETRLGMWSPK